ncbi:hypothetical protein [Aquimarina muelleri]|nr:hypothetical protein [Aquimarina muelleri]MCX2763982.1 hypothetical protein [Aquimarina muelleri]
MSKPFYAVELINNFKESLQDMFLKVYSVFNTNLRKLAIKTDTVLKH